MKKRNRPSPVCATAPGPETPSTVRERIAWLLGWLIIRSERTTHPNQPRSADARSESKHAVPL
jgi:hypothetical protein